MAGENEDDLWVPPQHLEEIERLRAQLATAEKDRDEARRLLDGCARHRAANHMAFALHNCVFCFADHERERVDAAEARAAMLHKQAKDALDCLDAIQYRAGASSTEAAIANRLRTALTNTAPATTAFLARVRREAEEKIMALLVDRQSGTDWIAQQIEKDEARVRAEVIEECAKVVDLYAEVGLCRQIAATIRALLETSADREHYNPTTGKIRP